MQLYCRKVNIISGVYLINLIFWYNGRSLEEGGREICYSVKKGQGIIYIYYRSRMPAKLRSYRYAISLQINQSAYPHCYSRTYSYVCFAFDKVSM